MTDAVNFAVDATLIVLVFLLLPTSYRFLRGPSAADRMLALDMLSTLLIGVIVLLSYISSNAILVDVALGLAAVSFIATLGLARYVSEGRIF
ncbi:MAG: cation:proton antiporter [Anaerolineae bacterium]|nr:cation:proton antiporter [Anaerolineae bacterium]